MRAWAVCLGVVVQLGAALPAHALDGHRRVTQYAQTHFGARDGMPHGYSDAIAQTADGYLWSASQEGLSRFDGAGFTTYDARKTEGVPVNHFTALAVDSAGTLWAGTYDHGVLHVVDGTFHTVAWEPGPQEQMIHALAFDAGGDLWIGMRDRGVVRLHAGKLIGALTTQDGLPSDDIRSFLPASDGAMWIGTFKGLARWKAGQITRGPEMLEGAAIHAIAQGAQGDLWCGTEKGLAHVRGDTVELFDEQRLPASDVHAVLFDRDGNLWIGTSAGAARLTPDGQIQRLPQPDGGINALFEDREGNLWIGGDRGLDRLFDGDMIPVGAAEGLTDQPARSVREAATGALWVTTTVGLFMIPAGQTLATKVAPADRGVMFALYEDSHGDIWVGTAHGDVGRWHAGKFSWVGHQHWERIRSFAETAAGMWVGTNHGVFQLQGDRLEDAKAIVPGVMVGAIVPDRTGSVWLATAGAGLMRWHAGAPAPIPPGGPPRTSPVSMILFDPDGTMWVGTTGAGLWRLHDGRWTAFTSKDGMFDDLIWSTLDDGLGNFWMSSNRGIWRVSRQQLEARAAGLRKTIDSVVYGEADGMRDRECNGAQDPAGWRTRDGRLWFPTGKGLVVIDPAHLHASRPPGALIASVRVDGEPHPASRGLVLRPGSSRLELGFTAPALRGPVRLRFRYRLEGFDHQWNEASDRDAQYTNLPAGDYKFVVEAGLDDAWGAPSSLEIELPPLFYETGWFYALALLSLALAIVAVPLLRVRQLRMRARELDKRVQEAIGELKVLSGLLPICAWCKKIRDDRGYWSKIEAYLSARTEAQFTHGICPDCTEKMLSEESFGRSTISQGGRR
jgi:ligand-binding sensor domain-containing protein